MVDPKFAFRWVLNIRISSQSSLPIHPSIQAWCLISYASHTSLFNFYPLCLLKLLNLSHFLESKLSPVVPPNGPPTMVGSQIRRGLSRDLIRKCLMQYGYLLIHLAMLTGIIARSAKLENPCRNKLRCSRIGTSIWRLSLTKIIPISIASKTRKLASRISWRSWWVVHGICSAACIDFRIQRDEIDCADVDQGLREVCCSYLSSLHYIKPTPQRWPKRKF